MGLRTSHWMARFSVLPVPSTPPKQRRKPQNKPALRANQTWWVAIFSFKEWSVSGLTLSHVTTSKYICESTEQMRHGIYENYHFNTMIKQNIEKFGIWIHVGDANIKTLARNQHWSFPTKDIIINIENLNLFLKCRSQQTTFSEGETWQSKFSKSLSNRDQRNWAIFYKMADNTMMHKN